MNSRHIIKKSIFAVLLVCIFTQHTHAATFTLPRVATNIVTACWKYTVTINTNPSYIVMTAGLGSLLYCFAEDSMRKKNNLEAKNLKLCATLCFSPMLFEFVYKMYAKK